jgi:16S rRNA processing protein RimM
MEVHTDFPERLQRGRRVYLGEAHFPSEIRSVRPHKHGVLIAFQGIQTPEEAAVWRNQWVYVRADELPPLPPGEYYAHELIGLQVLDETGRLLGELAEILHTPANKVYLVRKADGKELLLPAIPSVILCVDLPARQMRVHLLPGLE